MLSLISAHDMELDYSYCYPYAIHFVNLFGFGTESETSFRKLGLRAKSTEGGIIDAKASLRNAVC
jgi:hypothetical protein